MKRRSFLVLALPKGRVLGEAVALLRRAGIDARRALSDERRLAVELPKAGLRLLLLKPADVPTYVEHGAADAGVAGHDVLEEGDADVYEPLDLGIGRCRLVVAEPIGSPLAAAAGPAHERVATKYPGITRRHFERRGASVEIIAVSGSVEIAATAGLADRIVDLVQTGRTLEANRLREVETILDVTSRLIVNRAAMKLRAVDVARLVRRLGRALAGAR